MNEFRPAPKPERKRKLSNKGYQMTCRKACVARSRGRCEWLGCLEPGIAWHHTCGRGNKGIREPHASSPALTTMLCPHHHGRAHSVAADRDALRMAAARRLGITVDLAVTTPLRAIKEHLAAA